MKRWLLCLIAVVAFAFQGQQEIPPHEGPDHKGQPSFCINRPNAKWKANCKCKPMVGGEGCKDEANQPENPKCSVYCRKHACSCISTCTS